MFVPALIRSSALAGRAALSALALAVPLSVSPAAAANEPSTPRQLVPRAPARRAA
jgi:hypothetical protein